MSLSTAQLRQTSAELNEDLRISGLAPEQICTALHISQPELDAVLSLSGESPTAVWRVRDYLEEKIRQQGKTPCPYSALKHNFYYPYRRDWT